MPVYLADAEWVVAQARRNGSTNVRAQVRKGNGPWVDLDEREG